MSITTTRIVVHPSPADFLRAIEHVEGADSGQTNYLVGFVWTHKRVSGKEETKEKPDEDAEVLVTVWEGEELRLMFSKLASAQCKLVSPVPTSSLATLALPFVPQLVSHLLTLSPFSTSPALLRSISGAQLLVDAFLSKWPTPRKPEPSMWMLPCVASAAPPAVEFPPGHSVERILDFDKLNRSTLEQLAHLLIAFFAHPTAPKLDVEGAIQHLRKHLNAAAMWVYRASPSPNSTTEPSIPVGFVTTGRPTNRTIAIRGVFVATSHRRQGIAERMTAFVTRSHLSDAPRLPLRIDALSTDTDETPVEEEATTKWGGKDEVCLFVEPENPAARGVYRRIGFVESEVLWCDVDLEGIEAGSW